MLLFFVVGIDRTENKHVCTMMSILILYFTIASVCWMGAEAVLMFQKLVLVFRKTTNRQIATISIITWSKYLAMYVFIVHILFLWPQASQLYLLLLLWEPSELARTI